MIAELSKCVVVSVLYLFGVFVLLIAILIALVLRRLVGWAWPALFVIVAIVVCSAWAILIGSLFSK